MLSIIVAVADNGVIGCHNRLIWHISEDLKRFKSLTTGHPIIMGRKTYESIGRPLPGRQNIIVSRNPELAIDNCDVVTSLEQAIEIARGQEKFIIGGGEIYREALPLCDKLYLTRVEQQPEGDTFFPDIEVSEWVEVSREQREGYSFIDYIRCRD